MGGLSGGPVRADKRTEGKEGAAKFLVAKEVWKALSGGNQVAAGEEVEG